MHRIVCSLFACVAACALAVTNAPAAAQFANIAAAPITVSSAASTDATSVSSSTSVNRRHDRALTRAARKARKQELVDAKPKRTAARVESRSELAAERKAAEREQAESNARAERIYRASQFSAPIIIDAKACKRIGAHGESIYENC